MTEIQNSKQSSKPRFKANSLRVWSLELVDRKMAGELYGARFGKEGLQEYKEFIKFWIDEEFDTGEVKQYFLQED